MGTVKSGKNRERSIKNEIVPDWVWNIENDPHAIEKAKIAQKHLDTFGLPKDDSTDRGKH
ncbi:hypothetical protein SAMN04488109_5354 [Chryseolinea serpens]|uniref:Uncharacterized protein n=1 Tax=Chryseolinea serpens TaxID=947013 RepID=A0A1M5VRY1_9BACT|nr:hypothetical protein [Chryseolinea serpens]SHH78019.1 hypothetical protein SAMN04488109_5354 [Chryseolinea serpens]